MVLKVTSVIQIFYLQGVLMKRAGFTMIELIFVIVILGILAAVAIPKLAATRTDAEVSKLASEAATLVGELGTFYTAQGTFKGKSTSDITNVTLKAITSSIIDTTTLVITDDGNTTGANSCITITINNATDGNVTVTAGSTGSICKGVKAATASLQKTYNFGGSSVSW